MSDLSKTSFNAPRSLRGIIERTGWSLRRIGKTIGVTHTQVRRLLNGDQRPRDTVRRKITVLERRTNV